MTTDTMKRLAQMPKGTLLMLGCSGDEVVLLKRALGEHGYGPAAWRDAGKQLGVVFDENLRIVVTAFQRRHGLEPDGIAGPLTRGMLVAPATPKSDPLALLAPLRQAAQAGGTGVQNAVAVAREALRMHIHETGGNNRGPTVEAIQLYAAGSTHYAWCAAFCHLCISFGFAAAQSKPPLSVGISCSSLVARAAKLNRVFELADASAGQFKLGTPQPGDLLVLRGGPTHYHHVGLVVAAPRPDGVVLTIEGNTNDAGSAEGDGVYEKERKPKRTPCVFVTLR
jgi:hypothetical protein